MTKLKKAVHLDYITVKPYFTIKNILIFSALALFLTTMSDDISSGMGVGLMVATLFVSYPFALCEKNNLDALYATLSIKRKTIVQGRYAFTLSLNVCALLFSFILATTGLFIAKAVGFSTGVGSDGYLESTFILSAIFLIIQCIQLPIFFKLGYAKARVISIAPFAILMAGFTALMTLRNVSAELTGFLDKLIESGNIFPLLITVTLITGFVSYSFSAAFYAKRDF